MKTEHLTKILTYAGSLPFIFFTLLDFCDVDHFLSIYISFIIIAYGTIILSFISGMHFSYAILQNKHNIKLLVLSNIIALLSWVSLLINLQLALAMIMIGYLSNLMIDVMSYRNSIIPKWFFDLRLRISFIVLLCLILNFWHM